MEFRRVLFRSAFLHGADVFAGQVGRFGEDGNSLPARSERPQERAGVLRLQGANRQDRTRAEAVAQKIVDGSRMGRAVVFRGLPGCTAETRGIALKSAPPPRHSPS